MAPKTALIIGRGIIGLSAAFELAEQGWRIFVLGPRTLPGAATRAAVGVSSLKGQIQASRPLFAVKMQGHEALRPWLRRLEAAAGRPVAHDFVTGLTEPFFSATEYEGIRERVFHRNFAGCFNVQLKTPKLLSKEAEFATFLSTARGAFHYTRDGWYDPVDCLEALEEALRRRGATFVDAPATRLVPGTDRGVTVETPTGAHTADEVVVAAGVFTDDLLAASGLSLPRQELVPGETLRGEAPVALAPLFLRSGKLNLVFFRGRWAFGSTSWRAPDRSACVLNSDQVVDLRRRVTPLLTCSAFLRTPEADFGIRGRYRDRCPTLGPLFFPGFSRRVWVSTGFYKNGLQLAPLFARFLAALMTDRSDLPPLQSFSPTRFPS